MFLLHKVKRNGDDFGDEKEYFLFWNWLSRWIGTCHNDYFASE